MTTISNAGSMPSGTSRTRFMVNGRMVEVALNWDYIRDLAAQAITNKTQRSKMGPVLLRVIKS